MRVAGGAYLLNLSVKGIQIDEKIDSCIGKRLHTALVIGTGVHMVHSNGIGA